MGRRPEKVARKAGETRVIREVLTDALKAEAVSRLVFGESASAIAKEYGIGTVQVYRWRDEALLKIQDKLALSMEDIREVQLMRRQELIMAYLDAALAGDLKAAEFVSKQYQELEALHGLHRSADKEEKPNQVYVLHLPGSVHVYNGQIQGGPARALPAGADEDADVVEGYTVDAPAESEDADP